MAMKSDANNIVERERSIKAAEKVLGSAIVDSKRSTGATVVGSVKCN